MPAKSITTSSTILNSHEDDADSVFHYALALSANGQEQEALAHFTKLREAQPTQFDYWKHCFVSLRLLKRYTEVAELAQECLKYFADSTDRTEAFNAIVATGDSDAIVPSAKQFLASALDSEEKKSIYRDLAMCYANTGQRQEAQEAAADFDRLETDIIARYKLRANMLEELGDLESARAEYENILRERPDDEHFMLHCGVLAAISGDFRGAQKFFDEMSATGEFAAARCRNRAALCMNEKRFADALAELDTAITLEPADWRLHLARAQAHLILEDVAGAEEALRRAEGVGLGKDPEFDASVRPTKAAIYARRGKLSDAELLLRQAIEAKSGDSWALYNLAVVLFRKEEFIESRRLLRRALELRVDDTFELALGYIDVAEGRYSNARRSGLQLTQRLGSDWRCWHLLAVATQGVANTLSDQSLEDDVLKFTGKARTCIADQPSTSHRIASEADICRIEAQSAYSLGDTARAIRNLTNSLELTRSLGENDIISEINVSRLNNSVSASRRGALPQIGILLAALATEAESSVFLVNHLLNAVSFATVSIAALTAIIVGLALPTVTKVKVPGVEFERAMGQQAVPLELEPRGTLSFSSHVLDLHPEPLPTGIIGYGSPMADDSGSTVELGEVPQSTVI